MTKKFYLILLIFLLCFSFINAKPCCKVYGYLGSWSAPSGWTLDTIDWDALTHVLDAFAIPNSNGTVDTSQIRGAVLVNKAHSKNTRCMFSAGGATGSGGFATATKADYRTTFVNNLINIMTTNGYDGIDIDWEFPRSGDKSNFMAFMQQLYNAVKSSGNGYDGQPRELTFYTTTGWYDDGVDWGTIGNYVDYAIQSGYDWGNPANAPLHNTGTLTSAAGYVFEQSIDGFAQSIISRGFPREKFLLGLPFYSKPSNVDWGNHGTFSSYNTTYAEGSYSGQWFTDNQGYTDKLQYIRDQGRPGIAIWEISQIYPLTDLWNTIKTQSCAGGTPTLTFTPTRTNTPTRTRTNTQTNTQTFTRTPTRTNTPANTNTFTRTSTNTPTNTRTNTVTFTVTGTPPTNTFTFTQTRTFTFTNTATITPTPVVTPIRVNCGGSQYTGADGRIWQTDKAYVSGSWGYVGGQVGTDTTPGEVLNTDDDTLYYTERFDNPTYKFDVPNGQYTVILYFSEFYYTNAGERVFSISIEGTPVLTNYDIIADTGGPDRAVAKQFVVNVTDGIIDIISSSTVDLAKFSAIEIIQGTLTPTPTNTATFTFTPTITFTSTITRTFTNTFTLTYTRTSTNTSTDTPTGTYTITRTNTATNTNIPTNTSTNSLTHTRTHTFTNTPTSSITLTFTVTRTTTSTGTMTYTNTRTFTQTNTPTATYTFTITNTPSNTSTPTETVTGSQPPTWTYTNTFTSTVTFTSTQTFTEISSFTASFTLTATATFTDTATNTPTFTETHTLTITNTNTPTETFTTTVTFTQTFIFTNTFTYTATPSMTSTFTHTYTQSPTGILTQTYTITFTNTFTQIPTNTFTSTIILTPTLSITPTIIESEKLEIVNDLVLFFPNPYNYTGKPYIRFTLSKSAESLKIKLYTVALRFIGELIIEQRPISGINNIPIDNFPKLANGTYYYIIIIKNKEINFKSKINKLIILR